MNNSKDLCEQNIRKKLEVSKFKENGNQRSSIQINVEPILNEAPSNKGFKGHFKDSKNVPRDKSMDKLKNIHLELPLINNNIKHPVQTVIKSRINANNSIH